MPTITEPAKQRAATAYNAVADHFEDEALSFWKRYGGRTVDRLALHRGAHVVDVGCGTGASALPAAIRVGPTGEVIGVDLADRLLEIARQKAASQHLANVEFRFGDMERLGYPDQHFDSVICVFAIFFVPDMAKQVMRALADGPLRWPISHHHLGAASTGTVRQRLLVSGKGFTTRSRSPEDWRTIVIGSGIRSIVDQLGPKAAEQVREANLAWIRSRDITSVETNVIYAMARKAPI
jgi:SAM-dependent methyltransferase